MKFRFLFFLLVVFIQAHTYAQQDPHFSNYTFNSLVLNPAYAGGKGSLDAVMAIRNQWAGFNGAPKTQSLSLHTPLGNKKIGGGMLLVNDKLGASRITSFATVGSYRFNLEKRQRPIGDLVVGLRLGFLKYGIDWSQMKTTDPDDQMVLLGRATDKLTLPDFGFGLYFEAKNYYLGLSLPHLIPSKIDFTNGKSVGLSEKGTHVYYQLIFTAGYLYDLRGDVKIKPSILFKSVSGIPLQADISTTAIYKDKVRFGVSYRTGDAFVVLTEFWFKRQLRFGYAIDVTTSNVKSHSNGSHEVMIGYQFFMKRTKKQILNSRYYF